MFGVAAAQAAAAKINSQLPSTPAPTVIPQTEEAKARAREIAAKINSLIVHKGEHCTWITKTRAR